ncbi:putative minor capsid protein [Enterococcus gallinarum]|uniref:putative minor capsid protein n=1 Tax=Enterococcus gallinarum TaxID=1353 RepID=UPI001D170D0D|nr:putative minor capsid protein [Enterococcus gallinarum]MCC4043758.1 minor capsid protein [Enterococcus gallinarum]
MSFKPIPKHLLIHEVLYQAPKTEDDGSMGSGKLPKAQRIEHVRFTPKRRRIIKTDNTEVLTNGVLYIDAVNSKPFVNPSEDGTITFQNRKLKIVECYEVYTDQLSPHHIEVMLQ